MLQKSSHRRQSRRNKHHSRSNKNASAVFTIHATIRSSETDEPVREKKFNRNENSLFLFSSILSTRQHRLEQNLSKTKSEYQKPRMTTDSDNIVPVSSSCRSTELSQLNCWDNCNSNNNVGQNDIVKATQHYPRQEYPDEQPLNRKYFSKSSKVSDFETNKSGFSKKRSAILNETKKRIYVNKHFPYSCSKPCVLVSLLISLLLIGAILGSILGVFFGFKTTSTSTTLSIITVTTTVTPTACSCLCPNESWTFDSDRLARWSFDGTFTDTTNMYNVTSYNAPFFVPDGYVNQALLLNASLIQSLSTSYIPLAYTSFTIEVWLKPTLFPNLYDHSILGLCPSPIPYQCLHLVIRKINSNSYLYFGFFADDCQGNTSLTLNQWIHAAFVFDITTLTQSIYLNGILDNRCITSSPIIAEMGSVTIGTIPAIIPLFNTNFYQGYIDHLTITKRAKSSCEILEDATLVSCFLFDAATSNTDFGPNSLLNSELSTSIVSSGHSHEAISFNGTAYFQASSFTAFGFVNKSFSIVLWIRPRTVLGTIIHVSSLSNGLGWCVPFMAIGANGSIVTQVYSLFGVATIWGPSILMASVWSHITETWSSTNGLRLYVNGVLVSSLPSATSYLASTVSNFITVGNSLNGSGSCVGSLIGSSFVGPFVGDIDGFRVYSRELTATNIYTIYQN